MAEVVWIPGVEPANAGEQKVIDAFAARLAPSVRIFPNVQVALDNFQYQLVECDQLILAEDRMWLVEVKDLYGDVAFLQGRCIVDGDVREDAVGKVQLNAKRLKSRLVKAGVAHDLFVESRVVLAKAPQRLEVDPIYAPFVLGIDDAVDLISDPTGHGLPRHHLVDAQRDAIVEALALKPRRRHVQLRFGNIVAERLLAEDAARQLWAARETPIGKPWLVEVPLRGPDRSDAQWKADQDALIGRVRMLQALAGVNGVIVPHTVANADIGTPGVVLPVVQHLSLAEQADDVAGWADPVKRGILRSVARAVAACHHRAMAHRTIGPAAVLVDPTVGRAWLTDFARVHRTGDEDVVPAAAWPTLVEDIWAAPEHFAGGPVGPAADLYALGGLAQELWPDGVPGDLAAPVATLTSAEQVGRRAGLEALLMALSPKPANAPVEPGEGVTWAGYRLEERLGLAVEPGVSVWRAVATLTGQAVVIRIYDAEADHEGASVLATALEGVAHPNLAPVLAASIHDGRPYVVTALVAGPSLRVAVEQAGPLGPGAAVTAAVQVLSALSAVHPGRGDGRTPILHRRVSPDNVIARPDGAAVLVNFGPPAVEGTQVAVNDPRYRPMNEGVGAEDPDPDLFAVGVLLHEVATGAHPFTGEDPFRGELELDAALGQGLVDVLRRALASDRAARFTTATEFQAALIALGLPEVELPQVAEDILAVQRRIDAAIRDHEWDAADALCRPEWAPVRERIQLQRARWEAAEANAPLLTVEGFRLRFVRDERDVVGALADRSEVVGDRRIHLLDRPDGAVLTVSTFLAAQGAGLVSVTEVRDGDGDLAQLEGRLSIGIRARDDGRLTLDLRQAGVDPSQKPGAYRVRLRQVAPAGLDAGSGADVGQILQRFGAVAYGTRKDVLDEAGPKRNEVCVLFPRDAHDLPAVAFVLTRVAPVARGVVHPG